MDDSRTGTEAVVSWHVRYRAAEGYCCMLTLLGPSGVDVLTRAEATTRWLSEHGAQPDGPRPMATNAAGVRVLASPADEADVCPATVAAHKTVTAPRQGVGVASYKAGDACAQAKAVR